MNRVNTTHDKEKRAAFKGKLAARMVDAPETSATAPTLFNGVGVGATLYHPDLGPGTLVSFDAKDVVVDFGGESGPVSFPISFGFVLSPHAPLKTFDQESLFEDAFLGPDITRPLSEGIKPAAEFEPKPAPKPDPVNHPTLFNGVDVGGTLYHPTLGAGKLLSFGQTDVVMDFGFENGPVTFPSRQAKSILSPNELFAEPVVPAQDVFIGEAPARPLFDNIEPVLEFEPKPETKPEPKFVPTTFNNVAVGGTLYHPNLGAGTLVSFNDEEITLDFSEDHGRVSFATRIAKTILSDVQLLARSEEASIQDPFIGNEIVRPFSQGIEPAAEFEPKPEPIKSEPKPAPTTFNNVAVGGTLYHPHLGAGTLISFNTLEVIVEFPTEHGRVSFPASLAQPVLSDTQPYKVPIDTLPKEDPFIGEAPARPLFDGIKPVAEFEPKVTPSETEVITPTDVNGVGIGGTLYHPNLGAGTLVSFNTKEIVLDFPNEHGRVSFPARLVKPVLNSTPPKDEKIAPAEAFIGEEILRPLSDGIVPATEFETAPIESKPEPKPEVPNVNGVVVGGTLYHPTLGAGKLVSVDKNTVVLAVEGQNLELAARQAQSLLTPTPTRIINPETIPEPYFPPLVRMSDGIVPEDKPPAPQEVKAQVIEIPVEQNINGVSVGGKLHHQSFGTGVLKSINKNAVVMQFDWNEVSFVPSAASSILSPNIPEEPDHRDHFEEPYIDPIVRPNPVFIDITGRELDEDERPAVVFEPQEKPSALEFEGRMVWHPDFGASHVVSVDPSKNEIVLEVNDGEKVTLALRAIESKLSLLDEDNNLILGKTPPQVVL